MGLDILSEKQWSLSDALTLTDLAADVPIMSCESVYVGPAQDLTSSATRVARAERFSIVEERRGEVLGW